MLSRKTLKQRYEIIDAIGRGGFGDTYIAVDRDFPGLPHRVVKHLCPTHTDPVSLKEAKRLFEIEAKCLSKLGEHGQIPRLFAYFEEGNEFYLVQELVEGHNLTQEFQSEKKWSESETVDLLTELLSILSIVHQNKKIHRDIKPANIMRRQSDGKLVLIDFGAVKEVLTVDKDGQTDINNSTIGIGTPGYMPPEQAAGKPGEYSDVYAVGILGVQALSGLRLNHLLHNPPSDKFKEILSQQQIKISPSLKNFLCKAIALNPEDRFANASEALEVLVSTEPETVRSIPSTASNTYQLEADPTITIESFPKRLLLGIIGAIALIGGAGVYVSHALDRPDYTRLESYLENRQWKQADIETDKIILEIAREPSEVDPESANKFPCKALETIDRLWMENSDGRFGFTPQKEAYLETGNKFGEYAESIYEEFGDRVGWWSNRNLGRFWNLYENLNFKNDDSAPVGHLPSPGTKADKRNLRKEERKMLLSRFDKCGL